MFNYFHGKHKFKLIRKYESYLFSINFYAGKHFN